MGEKKYKTKQRDEILRFFEENQGECFSAREVAKKVEAGEATVFRTIAFLCENGYLRRFKGDSSSAFYQYNLCPMHGAHIHLMCEKCGSIIHMDCSFVDDLRRHFKDEHSFELDCAKTIIYGTCADCAVNSVNNENVEKTKNENVSQISRRQAIRNAANGQE
mgnify:CR=1 FL=1